MLRAKEISRTDIAADELDDLLKDNSTLKLPLARAGLSVDTAHALKVTRRESTVGLVTGLALERARIELDIDQPHHLRPDVIPFGPTTGRDHYELVLGQPADPKDAVHQQAFKAFMDTLVGRSKHTGEQPARAVQAFQENMKDAGGVDWKDVLEHKAGNARKLFNQIAADKQEKIEEGKPTAEDVAALMLSVEAIHMLDQVKKESKGRTSEKYELYGVEVDPTGEVHKLELKMPTVSMKSEVARITTVTKRVGRRIVFIRHEMGEHSPDYGRNHVAFKM